MSSPYPEENNAQSHRSRADVVCTSLERAVLHLAKVCMDCGTAQNPKDFFDIGMLGYGKEAVPVFHDAVIPLNSLIKNGPARTSQVRAKKSRTHSAQTNLQWYEPVAEGPDANMSGAYDLAADVLSDWMKRHPNSIPPLLINITDGNPATLPSAAVIEKVSAIKNRTDNPLVLLNCLITEECEQGLFLPSYLPRTAPADARLLFDISSPLVGMLRSLKANMPAGISREARGFVYNPSVPQLDQFLEICTAPLRQVEGILKADNKPQRISPPAKIKPVTPAEPAPPSIQDSYNAMLSRPESEHAKWIGAAAVKRVSPCGEDSDSFEESDYGEYLLHSRGDKHLVLPPVTVKRVDLHALSRFFEYPAVDDPSVAAVRVLALGRSAVCESTSDGTWKCNSKGSITITPVAISRPDDKEGFHFKSSMVAAAAIVICVLLSMVIWGYPWIRDQREIKSIETLIESDPEKALARLEELQREGRQLPGHQILREQALGSKRRQDSQPGLVQAQEQADRGNYGQALETFRQIRSDIYKGIAFPPDLAERETALRKAAAGHYQKLAVRSADYGLKYVYLDSAQTFQGSPVLDTEINKLRADHKAETFASLFRRAGSATDCSLARTLINLCISIAPNETRALRLREEIHQRCPLH